MSIVRTQGFTRYIDVSCIPFKNEVVGENPIVVEGSACVHNKAQQLNDVNRNSRRHFISGERPLYLSIENKRRFFDIEDSLLITSSMTRTVAN